MKRIMRVILMMMIVVVKVILTMLSMLKGMSIILVEYRDVEGYDDTNTQKYSYYRKVGDPCLDTGCCLLQLGRYRYQVHLAKVLIRFWLLVQGMKTKLKHKVKTQYTNKWHD